MALPNEDPRRPLYAAARHMTTAGAVHLSVGLLCVLPALRAWPMAVASGVLIAGGIGFLIFSSVARRHKLWAVWCGIATGVVMGTAVAMVLALLVAKVGWHDAVRLRSGAGIVSGGFILLVAAFVVVHVLIVWHLSNAFDGLREPPLMPVRSVGFSPVLPSVPQRVLPIEADDAPPAAR